MGNSFYLVFISILSELLYVLNICTNSEQKLLNNNI